MDIKAVVTVYPQNAEQTPDNVLTRCQISPVPLPFDSTGEIVDDSDPMEANWIHYTGDPFVPAPGAGVATWADLPASVYTANAQQNPSAINLCAVVDPLLEGPGGIWVQGTAAITADPPANNGGGGGTQGQVATKCKKGFKKVGTKCKKVKKKKKKK
jgi:hypothetical protein